ncbi:hypothetical protein TNCV_3027581 [Trichonephila clavipes]|nr:hypothetical protein TNCV_3027581 [Trichonephila clavipes]
MRTKAYCAYLSLHDLRQWSACADVLVRWSDSKPPVFSSQASLEIKSPVNFRADPLKSLGKSLPRPQSPLIGERIRPAHGFPHFSPTPLVIGDNRPTRLIPTPTLYLVHHLEGYKSPCHIDPEGVPLSSSFESFVAHRYEGEPNTMDDVSTGFSFLQNIETKDRLEVGERKSVATSKPLSESAYMCYALGMRKE